MNFYFHFFRRSIIYGKSEGNEKISIQNLMKSRGGSYKINESSNKFYYRGFYASFIEIILQGVKLMGNPRNSGQCFRRLLSRLNKKGFKFKKIGFIFQN